MTLKKTLLTAAALALAAGAASAQTELRAALDAARAAVATAPRTPTKPADAASAAPKSVFPELKACESADWSKTGTSSPVRTEGAPATGWEGRMGPSLVLLTKTAAYYYHEDCDICAEITRCELSTGALSSHAIAHMLDCRDLAKPRSEPGVAFDACRGVR